MKAAHWRKYRSMAAIVLLLLAALSPAAYPQRPRRVDVPEKSPASPGIQDPKPSPKNPQRPAEKTKPDEDPGEAIKINSSLVAVPVSVTDAAGLPVQNITAEQFRLEEEGTVQSVSLLGQPGQTPIELALLFDVSGSVQERYHFEQQAAARFLRTVMKPADHVAVFSIGLTPKLVVQRTKNVEQAITGTMNIGPTKEATAFYDSVGRAAQYLGEGANPGVRRVIVVISDGEDNQSEKFRLEETLRELQRNDCLFYSINPSGPGIRLNKISMKGHDAMIALAAETGGVAFLPDKLEDLDRIFRQIATELQSQYLLGYYSTNEATDGKFRRITARINGRPELRVRFRQGYYAPRE
jgi:Ca-activated chloride channel family protein